MKNHDRSYNNHKEYEELKEETESKPTQHIPDQEASECLALDEN